MSTLNEIENAHAKEVGGKISSYRKNKKIKFLSSDFNDFTVKQTKKVLGRSRRVFGRLIMLQDCGWGD